MLKTVGTSGQISLGRKYAGWYFEVGEEESGVITLTPQREIPESQAWLHTPEMREKLQRADAWMDAHPPRETDLEELMKEVEKRLVAQDQIRSINFHPAGYKPSPLGGTSFGVPLLRETL